MSSFAGSIPFSGCTQRQVVVCFRLTAFVNEQTPLAVLPKAQEKLTPLGAVCRCRRQFIADHYPWFLHMYDNYSQEIMRINAARYFIVYHYGGMYLDIDMECKASGLLHARAETGGACRKITLFCCSRKHVGTLPPQWKEGTRTDAPWVSQISG